MTLDGTPDTPPETPLGGALYAVAHAARAGAVGAGLGLIEVWIMEATARWTARCNANLPVGSEDFSCLGGAIVAALVVPLLALPVGWLLLRLLEVRPTWTVAVLGVLFSPGILSVTWRISHAMGAHQAFWVVIPGVVVAYAAGALVAAPRLRIPYRVVAGALAVGAAALSFTRFG